MTPTAGAAALYQSAHEVIVKLDDLKNAVQHGVRTAQRSLTVASSLGMLDYLTVRFLRDYRAQVPDVSLNFQESVCRTARQRLLDGEAEVGFLVGPVDPLTFRSRPFSQHHHCLILHRTHPLAQKERIGYADLDGQPLATAGADIVPSHNLRKCFRDAGVSPVFVVEATEIALTHRVASMNEGIGISTDFAAWGNVYPNTVIRPFSDMQCIEDRQLVCPVDRELSDTARAFIDFSFDRLRRHKHELFHWPEPYGYLNDWYDRPEG